MHPRIVSIAAQRQAHNLRALTAVFAEIRQARAPENEICIRV